MRAGRARPLEALARSGWALAAWVGLATVAAPGLLGLGHDNSPEVFFVRDDTALADYRSFTSRFSDFGALRVVAEGPGLWTREGLAWLGRVERRAPGVRGVVAASGPSGAHPSETGGWPPADPLAERDRLAAEPLARDMGWIASGGEAASLLLAVRRLAPGERRRLLAELDDLLADRPPEVEARVVGIAAVNRALDRAVGATLAILFPLVVALGAAAIALALRSGRDTALPLLVAALTQTVIFGTMGHLGVAFSIVTSILPLLLFVLALATVLHLLLAVREERRAGLAPEAAVAAAYRRKAWPVLWTGLTTGIGFGSLAISDSPPVRALGLWAAFGIAVLLAAAFTLCPALLARSRPPRPAPRTPFERRGRRLGATAAGLATRRPAAVHLLFLLTLLGALAGVPRLEVETGVLEYFRPGHPARAGLEALEAKGVGAVSAELLITLPGGSFESAAAGGRLGRLGDRLRAAPSALGVVTAADLPSADPELARRARPLLLADGGATTRVVIFLPFAGFTRLEPLFAEARAAAAAAFPEATVTLTGHYPMVLAAQRRLLGALTLSLALTAAAVVTISIGLVRGGRLALAAVVPNLWPVAVALGAMGWLGVPIDAATVMIAAVVLGVAVDDTLHYLGALRRAGGGRAPAAAARWALEEVAPAHLLTTLVLAGGFAVLAGSSFLPVARFGGVAAMALLAALAADFLWVPALTAAARRRELARFTRRPAGDRPPRG